MEKVAIIGMGLIGASVGLGLRKWATTDARGGPKLHVTGFDIDLEQQQQAQRMKATDEMHWDLLSAMRDADLVVIATPVGAVREVFQTIGDHLKHGSVVTDTCSTKAQVLDWARELLPTTTNFVGGHPLAGKTQSTEAAEATLFKGATWCITPGVKASQAAIQTVLGLVAALEAEPQFIDATEHDAFVGGVSHLPFLLSSALMHTVSAGPGWRDMKLLSSTGFRDVSRLAAGSPVMYRDICLSNRESLLRWIDEYVGSLTAFKTLLDTENADQDQAIEAYFTTARDARADWATAERRDGELLQETETELAKSTLAGQFSQMLFGGLARRRPTERAGRPTRDDRSG